MSRSGREVRRSSMAVAVLTGSFFLIGCEEAGTDSVPPPSVTQTLPAPTPTNQGGSAHSGSALGQAKRQAESTVDKLEQRQQDLLKQMDGLSD